MTTKSFALVVGAGNAKKYSSAVLECIHDAPHKVGIWDYGKATAKYLLCVMRKD